MIEERSKMIEEMISPRNLEKIIEGKCSACLKPSRFEYNGPMPDGEGGTLELYTCLIKNCLSTITLDSFKKYNTDF